MHLSLERKIAAAFVVGILVRLAIGVTTWLSPTRAEHAFALVAHTHVVDPGTHPHVVKPMGRQKFLTTAGQLGRCRASINPPAECGS